MHDTIVGSNAVATAKQPSNAKKPARPNYNKIHAKPFPLETHPLPAFIPHNPLSALRIAYFVLSQLFFPPTSHPPVLHKALFSCKTRSVNVTDPVSVRALWEGGFFGKGTLSRSEPTWLLQEKRRRGISTTETAEEITERRREERREMKRERARKERETVEEQLMKEGKVGVGVDGIASADRGQVDIKGALEQAEKSEPINESTLEDVVMATRDNVNAVSLSKDGSLEKLEALSTDETQTTISQRDNLKQDGDSIKDEEHLQLSYEETFFLAYGLGALNIYSEETQDRLTNLEVLRLFRQYSYFPTFPSTPLQIDDPFLISYAVYHHFRSLGWVVRHGLKFAVDYLLYNRGPVFSHAEFAVVIVPAYEHLYWSGTPARATETRRKTSKSWWWLHGVNRVQAQVRKNLVLAYVEIPPERNEEGVIEEVQDIGCLLKRYKVREFILKRWTPNRNRD